MPSALPWRLAITAVPVSVSRGYPGQPTNQPLSHWPQPPTALVCAGLRTTTSTVQPRDPTRKPKLYALPDITLRRDSSWQAGGGARRGPQGSVPIATFSAVRQGTENKTYRVSGNLPRSDNGLPQSKVSGSLGASSR